MEEVNVKPLYQDREWLEDMIVNKNMSYGQIAREQNTYSATVREWAIKFGIKQNNHYRLK